MAWRTCTQQCLVIMNRANPALLDYMQYYLDNTDALKGERYRLAKEFGQMLLSNCREAVGTAPLYRDGQPFLFLCYSQLPCR